VIHDCWANCAHEGEPSSGLLYMAQEQVSLLRSGFHPLVEARAVDLLLQPSTDSNRGVRKTAWLTNTAQSVLPKSNDAHC
jgi:hypothetical protein